MSQITVDPAAIQRYGQQANECFADARRSLEQLVAHVVEVRYEGPNAVEFKRNCGNLAAEVSQSLLQDMQRIADGVSGSTSAIAAALGGSPVTIAVNSSPVAVPSVPGDTGVYSADTSGLSALTGTVAADLGQVSAALAEHQAALAATGDAWSGQAKNAAVDVVARFTAAADESVSVAKSRVVDFINSQIQAVTAADR